MRVFIKGTMLTGTAGVGWIIVDPLNAAANDLASLYHSAGGSTGNTIAVAQSIGVTSNSDYSAADYGQDADSSQVRIVSAGLRYMYTGTELNKGGSAYCLVDPTHSNLFTASAANLGSEVTSVKLAATDRNWTNVLYNPLLANEYNMALYTQATSTSPNRFYMAVIVTAPDSTTRSYDYEFFVNLEVQGRAVRGQTWAHADPIAFNAAITTMQQVPVTLGESSTHVRSFLEAASHYVKEGITHVASIAQVGKAIKDTYDVAKPILTGQTARTAATILSDVAPYLAAV